ncbi:MAG: aminopeptidase [Lachnospiraceae bacterium]|nr:aminopeptidase [Lachnospiraceae bacterium]
MTRDNCWKKYTDEQLRELEALAVDYRKYLDNGKTERECVKATIELAKEAGYRDLQEIVEKGESLQAGDLVYATCMDKAIALFCIGREPMDKGMRILGAHIDSPRLDVKQNPLYEDSDLVLLDTHYYGGVKKYQWVTTPLALHGVVAKKDGSCVEINIGEAEEDPIFCVTDLLIHLSQDQLQKKGGVVVEGEDLDLLIGSRPMREEAEEETAAAALAGELEGEDLEELAKLDGAGKKEEKKTGAKELVLSILKEKYGIEEEDFLSAELEIVPAGKARDCGLDRSMIAAYGQDDRVCAFTSLAALLEAEVGEKTYCCLLVDKEEIGSVGATGMQSRFFENTVAEVMNAAGCYSELALRRCLSRSKMLSSDVSAAYDPLYAGAFEKKNAAFFGRGLVFNKFTGSRGKSGSNDANAEYIAWIRRVMDEAGVGYQTAELGRVDLGGGGTIAYISALYGMEVIDSGVALLSMHAPVEVASKADIYEAKKGYGAFLAAK